MSALCLLGGGAVVRLAATAFTLSWLHTIEKIPWAEDWLVEAGQLRVVEVRIKGSGAGMEPPPEARLEGGFYRWQPADDIRRELLLRRSEAPGVGDWQLCLEGACRPLGSYLPMHADPVTLRACPADGPLPAP